MSHVCIDSKWGTAEHQKLFYEEFVPEGVEFDVEIHVSRLNQADVGVLLGILRHGAEHATHPIQFGANASSGWGLMSWELTSVRHNNDNADGFGDGVGFDCCTVESTIPEEQLPMRAPNCLSMHVSLDFDGPFLVNDASRSKRDDMSDEEKETHTNFTALRRASGEFWLPASSVRGALRRRVEFLWRSLVPKGDENDSPVTRLFGSTEHVSRLRVNEFREVTRPPGNTNDDGAGHQDFVAIDRFTGGAADGAKFDATFADRPGFTTELILNVDGLQDEDAALLRLALRDLCDGRLTVGWGGNKGYGYANGELSDAKIQAPSADQLHGMFQQFPSEDAREWVALILDEIKDDEATSDADAESTSSNVSTVNLSKGTLTVRTSNAGDRIADLRYQNEKGRDKHAQNIDHGEVSASLLSVNGEHAVEFELDKDRSGSEQVRIRPVGEPWRVEIREPHAAPENGFAHPYYFLRMEDRATFTDDLADAEPVSHERYAPGRYSGSIRVKLTAKTPLLICEDKPDLQYDRGDDHHTYNIRLQDGKPLIASSSVRGMLRSAYEAVTNSRFGVFPGSEPKDSEPPKGHGRRLGFREEARLKTVPVRIVTDESSESGLAAQIMEGTADLNEDGTCTGPLCAAWAAVYDRHWNVAGVNIHDHRKQVWAYLTPWHYRKRTTGGSLIQFDFWNVEAIEYSDSMPSTNPAPRNRRSKWNHAEPASWGKEGWEPGYLCINRQNMNRKHDERFFFTTKSSAPVPLTWNNCFQWQELIENYHDEHERDVKGGQTRPSILTAPNVYSRHISTGGKTVSSAEKQLKSGDLCYANIIRRDAESIIEGLYPVMISRKLHTNSPLDCLPKSLRPPTRISELSPADRVFGWVSQDADSAKGRDVSAYRGNLSIGPIACTTESSLTVTRFPQPQALAILGQPKPQQGRFYLGDANGKRQKPGLSRPKAGYVHSDEKKNRVRGPKVYPHHSQGLRANAWIQESGQQDLQKRSKQNRSLTGQVNEGTEFEFDIHVTNLSAVEIGALLWLLQLPDEHYLRIGLGKPLGFGSVRAEIVREGTTIANGADWIDSIGHFSQQPDSADLKVLTEQYETAILSANPEIPAAFGRAARGLGDLPVHYPRTQGQQTGDGEGYKWFTTNDAHRGPKYTLPDLTDEDVWLLLLSES